MSRRTAAPPTPAAQAVDTALEVLRESMALSARYVLADIESECPWVVDPDGVRWYDTRPMLDPHEHCPDVIEMARQALQHAVHRGLVRPHVELDYYVRVVG